MVDAEQPSEPRPRRRRATKFVLPDHHHDEVADERSAEHIEAFIAGLGATTERKTTGRVRARRQRDSRDRRRIDLSSGPDWLAALRHETARGVRYGRPTAVLLLEQRDPRVPEDAERVADRILDAIRSEARETDRAVRSGPTSFRLLLPESDIRAANVVVARLDRALAGSQDPDHPPVDLRVDVVTAPRFGSIEDALAAADRRRALEVHRIGDPTGGLDPQRSDLTGG